MTTLQTKTLATAAVARFEQTPDELERGHHPDALGQRRPPAAAGRATPTAASAELAAVAGRPAARRRPGGRRRESVVTLDRGATVLLYTDGLVERRDADLDAGMVRLRDALIELADLPLDELLRRAARAAACTGTPEDDVALVAVRLHRQDCPRPAGGRPERRPAGRAGTDSGPA